MSTRGRAGATAFTSTSIVDWFKPLRGEAVARLRTNSLGFIGLAIVSNLLPVPSPWRAFDVVWGRRSAGGPYYYLCALELLVFGVLAVNIMQALYALNYPRAPLPPPPSPAKSLPASPLSPSARQWRLQGLTPTSTPQRQKAFSTYAPSPISTPSRILNYSIPASISSPPDASFMSSVSSVPGSPASPLAAYRGRHSTSVGRAFDGSLLTRLAREDSDDDDA